MDDNGEEAPAASKRTKKSPYMPHELVWEILTRLPVKSLLRFSCVCKAWRSTISGDTSFQRAHLRLQKPFLLVSPHTVEDCSLTHIDKIGLYRLDDDNQQGATVPLVYATDDVSSDESMDGFAHCDGLVLLPGKATVRVLNPATRRALTLPHSPGADAPRLGPGINLPMHQALGLGHDPRSNAYKVARFYYRSMRHRMPAATGGYDYTIATEVFTIGTDVHWRETTNQPPYPIIAGVTATFFKGFLLCFINERALGDAAPGLLRFRLEDEAFGVMPQPPCCPRMQHAKPVLAELRGELCLACGSTDKKTIRMWMCDNVENPRWDQRYTIDVSRHWPYEFNPIAVFGDEIVFRELKCSTRRYHHETKNHKDAFCMKDLKYRNPSTGALGYQRRRFCHFDLISYIYSKPHSGLANG